MHIKMDIKMVFDALNAAFSIKNAALKRDFSISECKYKGKMQMQRQMHRKMVFMTWPKCGIYLLNASLKRDFSISECKYKGKMQMHIKMHIKMVFMP